MQEILDDKQGDKVIHKFMANIDTLRSEMAAIKDERSDMIERVAES